MKRLFCFSLFLLILVIACSKKEKSVIEPEEQTETKIRGVWMWGTTLYNQGSDVVVNKLAENYVKDVFLLVKGISGEKTDASLLTDFITKAHTKDIKIHLWYVVNSDDKFFANHPDASIYHCPKPSLGHQEPYPMNDGRINLLYPDYKQYVLDNIRYFLTNFDCDGIHLDYIRYSHFVYSFDQYHLQKADSVSCDTQRLLNLFVQDYNHYAYNEGFVQLYYNGDADVKKWVELRKNTIYDYIHSVRELIDELKPETKLTAAFMPEGATDPQWGDAYYSQNYTLLSPLLDMIAPMAYFKDFGQPTNWLKTVTEKALSTVDSSCRIATGVQSYGGVTAEQLREQINYALDGGASGVVIFRYGDTSPDQWQVIKEEFQKISENENN